MSDMNQVQKIEDDLMVAYLTNARLTTVARREILFELGGLQYFINPCA